MRPPQHMFLKAPWPGAVCFAAGNTGDTGDDMTSSLRLVEGLVASAVADDVGLSIVLGDVGVYEVDYV